MGRKRNWEDFAEQIVQFFEVIVDSLVIYIVYCLKFNLPLFNFLF